MANIIVTQAVADNLVSTLTGATELFDSSTGKTPSEIIASVNNVGKLSNQNVKKELYQSQPAGITTPVSDNGKIVANFMSSTWSKTVGNAVITESHSGYDANGDITGIKSRTGQPEMLLVEPTDNEVVRIEIAASSILTSQTNGKIGIWMYVDNNGTDNSMSATGNISVTLSNNPTNPTSNNGLFFGFNHNQIRHGWNFLTFVQRNPNAYRRDLAQSESETHPFGISATGFNDGLYSDIKNNDLTMIRIEVLRGQGYSYYFDSIWCDWNVMPQIVLGCDGGPNFMEIARQKMDSAGFTGYCAFPVRVWSEGSKLIADFSINQSPAGVDAYNNGWDFTNHTANHLRVGEITNPAEIDYELSTALAWQLSLGLVRGAEFYVSPQSNSSQLSEKVIKNLGFKLQRHARHTNNHVTSFGLDSPSYCGSSDISSGRSPHLSVVTAGVADASAQGWQTFSKIKAGIDTHIAYQSAFFPFWHGITTVGDSGSGEDSPDSDLLMTESAFNMMIDYIKTKSDSGEVQVCNLTEFYYGK